MLHSILSTNICSLRAETLSLAVAMDIIIVKDRIINIEYQKCIDRSKKKL